MRKLIIVVTTLMLAASVGWAADKIMDTHIKASKVIGQSVKDSTGEKVGTLDELILDPEGRVTHAILSVGGFLGMGDKRVAVSWGDLTFKPKQDTIVINKRKEDLKKAPSYESYKKGQ